MQRIETNLWIFLAGINGFIAVGASALADHAFAGQMSEAGRILYMQGADYQMSHALALLGVGVLDNFSSGASARWLKYAGSAFAAGILLFSGSLYWLGIHGSGSLGALGLVTPLGGLSLLSGWVLLSLASWRVVWGKKGEG
jgi:uncharacterized membrane protein YgdD (TMEM256/DUF423 family)